MVNKLYLDDKIYIEVPEIDQNNPEDIFLQKEEELKRKLYVLNRAGFLYQETLDLQFTI